MTPQTTERLESWQAQISTICSIHNKIIHIFVLLLSFFRQQIIFLLVLQQQLLPTPTAHLHQYETHYGLEINVFLHNILHNFIVEEASQHHITGPVCIEPQLGTHLNRVRKHG